MDRAELRIEVVYCPEPDCVDQVELRLPEGSTAADALAASGLLQRHLLDASGLRLGVWGKACDLAALLREGDRVEIYRELRVDPMTARRLRQQRHQRDRAQR